MGSLPRTPSPTRRPERFRQATSTLLRQLNLLICGADVEELQDIVATLVSTQAYATARLIEERRGQKAAAAANGAAKDGGRNGQHGAGTGVARPSASGETTAANGGTNSGTNGGTNGGVTGGRNGAAHAGGNGAVAVPTGRPGNGTPRGSGPGRLGTR